MEELQEETAMLYDKIMHHALYFFLSAASLAGITFQFCWNEWMSSEQPVLLVMKTPFTIQHRRAVVWMGTAFCVSFASCTYIDLNMKNKSRFFNRLGFFQYRRFEFLSLVYAVGIIFGAMILLHGFFLCLWCTDSAPILCIKMSATYHLMMKWFLSLSLWVLTW